MCHNFSPPRERSEGSDRCQGRIVKNVHSQNHNSFCFFSFVSHYMPDHKAPVRSIPLIPIVLTNRSDADSLSLSGLPAITMHFVFLLLYYIFDSISILLVLARVNRKFPENHAVTPSNSLVRFLIHAALA